MFSVVNYLLHLAQFHRLHIRHCCGLPNLLFPFVFHNDPGFCDVRVSANDGDLFGRIIPGKIAGVGLAHPAGKYGNIVVAATVFSESDVAQISGNFIFAIGKALFVPHNIPGAYQAAVKLFLSATGGQERDNGK